MKDLRRSNRVMPGLESFDNFVHVVKISGRKHEIPFQIAYGAQPPLSFVETLQHDPGLNLPSLS